MSIIVPLHSLPRRPSIPNVVAPRDRRILAEAAGLALLVTFCGVTFFYGLNAGELYRTESLRAIVAQEILKSGNWIVPVLYGDPLLTKPPGMYAAIAVLSWPLGRVTESTARLPSALAALAVVLLFYCCFRRLMGYRAGLVAALVTPLSLMWLDKATAAEIDMMQVAWVSAAILFFLRALEICEASAEADRVGERRAGWCWWLAALLCVAGGFLTKWTAPAFFYSTVIPVLWWRGRLRLLWCRPHVWSVALAATIGIGWVAAAIASVGWETFFTTVSREALMRLSPGHHHRPYPWGETLTHPIRVFVATLPASVFAAFALRPSFVSRWDEPGRRLWQTMHCWVWPNLLFWSLVPEHSVRHSFPLFPGITGLAALVWVDWFRRADNTAGGCHAFAALDDISGTHRLEGPRKHATRPRRVLIGLLVAWLALKVAFVHAVVPARNTNREPRAKGEQIAALVPANEVLYLFRLKDEGIMFYYGRSARRLSGPEQLPYSEAARYCILDESEWRQWNPARPAEPLLHLRDEQGDPIVLVRVADSALTGKHGP